MAVVAQEVGRAPSSERPWRIVWRVVAGLAIVAVVAAIGLTAWVWMSPPVSAGSTVAGLGNMVSCDPAAFGGEPSLICYEVPFAEGEGVGIGFTVRNSAPIPLTIAHIDSYGPPYNLSAHLYPELTRDAMMFGLGAGRPFEAVEVAPGEEVAIQFVGSYRPCEEVAQFQEPGSAAVITHAQMTLRWAFAETDVMLPLGAALSLPGPRECT